jgi:putative phosphoribosyl transferase
MYFASRLQAGRMLAEQLAPRYRYENCAVIALDDGGAMVGAQIAMQLHCVLTMLDEPAINVPIEPEASDDLLSGTMPVFNQHGSTGREIDRLVADNYGIAEQAVLTKVHDLDKLFAAQGTISKELLKEHNVIFVSDGLRTGFPVDLAAQFLKQVSINKMIVATPLASTRAVDRMHVMADELYCMSVLTDYLDTDHYYDKHDVPNHDTVITTIKEIVLNWK